MNAMTDAGKARATAMLMTALAIQMAKIAALHMARRHSDRCRECDSHWPCETYQMATKYTTSADL